MRAQILLSIAAAQRSAAGRRAADEEERLIRVIDEFPMPYSAPEANLVGSALRDRFTASEMEGLLKSLVRC